MSETFDSEDVANTVRALADDFLAKYDGREVDAWDAYAWLTGEAQKIEDGSR